MKWTIEYSKQAIKFARKNDLIPMIREEMKKFLSTLGGKECNVDIKRLRGNWEGYLRIRKGNLRIIFFFDKKNNVIYVDKVDFRGDVYKS